MGQCEYAHYEPVFRTPRNGHIEQNFVKGMNKDTYLYKIFRQVGFCLNSVMFENRKPNRPKLRGLRSNRLVRKWAPVGESEAE